MELIQFIFWEALKILGLVFLGLVAAKAVAGLATRRVRVKAALYALILALTGAGAWYAGNDIAAEDYSSSCYTDLARGDVVQGYKNALRAVRLRPANARYWRAVIQSKMQMMQLQSTLDDEKALGALEGGNLDEVDDYQFALCAFFLGQYDRVTATTSNLIRKNPSYAAPYVLQGIAYTAVRKISRGGAELPDYSPEVSQPSGGGGGPGPRLFSGRRPAAGAGGAGSDRKFRLPGTGATAV